MEINSKKNSGVKWEMVKLGEVATFVNGYPFKPSDWSTEGLEIIRIQNLTRSTSESNYYSGSIPEKYKITKGDILISWSATLDIFIWDGNDAWLNQHIFKVVFDKIEIDKNYFIYAIKNILDDMRKQVHGATMQHITKGKFDNLLIPLPPLSTQKRIAEILDAADALRRKDQELLKKYDALAEAIFIDMFGDPVKNEKGWEVRKIGALCKLQGGYAFSSSDIIESGIRLVKIGNVHFRSLSWEEIECLPYDFIDKYKEYALNEGDILIALTRPIIKSLDSVKVVQVNKRDLPCLLNQRVGRFKLGTNINSSFLLSFLYSKHFRVEVDKYCSTSLQPNVSTSQIEEINIYCPPIELQKEFENRLLQIQNGSHFLANYKSETLFQSLLQQAFNGEL